MEPHTLIGFTTMCLTHPPLQRVSLTCQGYDGNDLDPSSWSYPMPLDAYVWLKGAASNKGKGKGQKGKDNSRGKTNHNGLGKERGKDTGKGEGEA